MTELDLAARLHMHQKELRSILQEMKRDKFIQECHQDEHGTSYYFFDEHMFINVVKYRLIRMTASIEDCERQRIREQLSFKCRQCDARYNEDKIFRLFNATKGELICLNCASIVVENTTAKVSIDYHKRVYSLYQDRML
jgi:transcription initiation factor IIE alpha subunit